MGLPFIPVKSYQGSDYLMHRTDLKQITDPFTGERTIVVPPIIPDFCFVHGFAADRNGNVLIYKTSDSAVPAKAAHCTMVSVEKVVDNLESERNSFTSYLSNVYVDTVILSNKGAYPTGCPGSYEYDIDAVKKYIHSFKNDCVNEYLHNLKVNK